MKLSSFLFSFLRFSFLFTSQPEKGAKSKECQGKPIWESTDCLSTGKAMNKTKQKQSYIEVPQVMKDINGQPDRVVAVWILSTPVTDLVVIACRKILFVFECCSKQTNKQTNKQNKTKQNHFRP